MDAWTALASGGRIASSLVTPIFLWFLGRSSGSTSCECVIRSINDPNAAVLELLSRQLERCGPEQLLCPVPRCDCSCPAVEAHYAGTVAISIFTFLLGLVLGRLARARVLPAPPALGGGPKDPTTPPRTAGRGIIVRSS